jgi:cation diffusion facilitator CzcD-associated flavoprotein CzcO
LEDKTPPPNLPPGDLEALATRASDVPLPTPTKLPARQPKLAQARYAESSVYPYLETNVDSLAMSFSQEAIPETRSRLSVSKHGDDTPFRSHAVIRGYVESLVRRSGYEKLVSYNTSVESAEKVGNEWRLVLRKDGNIGGEDEWWEEWFDAVVVASGHFNVPYIPRIEGLAALEREHPGSVKHSKMFRGRDAYKGKVRAMQERLQNSR